METGLQNLRKMLALAVGSIQWSYSIFWSTSSSSDPGVLEWGEGYYNGDIKTRKTVQDSVLDVDQMGLQRSEQLRELYESLLAGDSNPQARRPSASLLPEDLSNTEWYYLVCMSFVFNLGQGLPGRTLEIGKPIWICNAHQADSKEFCRSLLAKSASIQTVVCFPFLGGVIEMGVTDMVLQDLAMIQSVQAVILGIGSPALTPAVQCEEMRLFESPGENSTGFGLTQPTDQTKFMVECPNGELIDDEMSNCVHTSMTFSDCISQNVVISKTELMDGIQDSFKDDLHYRNVLTSLFKSTSELIFEPCSRNRDNKSCFSNWRSGDISSYCNHTNGSSQRVLKKILTEVPRMHEGSSVDNKVVCFGKDKQQNLEGDKLPSNNVIVERRRRERVNDKFSALKSLIPSIDKVDKASILDDTINYLKDLKRRVEDLEMCNERKTHTKSRDMAERISDNYGNNNAGVKRKSGESDINTNISISLTEKDVLIELRCPWKESLLLEIIDALSSLRLDTHTVQSSTYDSFLSLTIKAKIIGLSSLSTGMIKLVLERVLMNL